MARLKEWKYLSCANTWIRWAKSLVETEYNVLIMSFERSLLFPVTFPSTCGKHDPGRTTYGGTNHTTLGEENQTDGRRTSLSGEKT